MATKEGPLRISADQIISTSKNRKIITCSLSLDVGLSGGIPLGASVIVAGKSKAGKTSMCLQYAANAQNMFGSKIFFFNIEGRLSHQVLSQVQGIKTDLDNFEIIMPPPIRNKQGEIVGHTRWYAEQWWDEIGKTIQDNPKSIIIVDSIAKMSSEKEVSEDMGYQGRGALQKLEAQFCRKYGDIVVPQEVCLFLLTQIQANTSGYGPHVQPKVGNAIKHQADIIMFCRKTTPWDSTGGKALGHDIFWNVDCSALGPPASDVKVPLRYGHGIDTLQDIIEHCIEWGVIQKKGAWMSLPFLTDDEKAEIVDLSELDDKETPVKVQGLSNIRKWFMIRPKLFAKLEKSIREKILI